MDLYLYYIEWENVSGRQTNGFANAETPERALVLFIQNYKLKMIDFDSCPMIWQIPQNASKEGVVTWDSLEGFGDIDFDEIIGADA